MEKCSDNKKVKCFQQDDRQVKHELSDVNEPGTNPTRRGPLGFMMVLDARQKPPPQKKRGEKIHLVKSPRPTSC